MPEPQTQKKYSTELKKEAKHIYEHNVIHGLLTNWT